jgi:hypothetical protein
LKIFSLPETLFEYQDEIGGIKPIALRVRARVAYIGQACYIEFTPEHVDGLLSGLVP